jgi:DNA-binding response OmpR family regulator
LRNRASETPQPGESGIRHFWLQSDLHPRVAFLAAPGQSHHAMRPAVCHWGDNRVEQALYLCVFIGYLRKKLEADEGNPRYILTDPWIGYRFEPGE